MNKINVGIIGLGIGFKHLSNLKKNKNIGEIFVHDKIKKKTIQAKKLFKSINICKNENELFQNKKIHLICICSYDNFHFQHVVKAIRSKKDIFVEKPLCTNQKQLEQINNLIKKYQINISSNFVLRENSFFKMIKEKIRKDFFGKIYLIEANYNYGRLEKITHGWRGKIKNYSITQGGGIHLVDLVKFLTKKKFIKVVSEGNNISIKKKGLNFLDCISSIIKFGDDSILNLTSNFGSISPHHHCLNIFGTKGTGIYQLNRHLLISNKDKNKIIEIKNIKNDKELILNNYIKNLVSKNKTSMKILNNEKKNLIETTNICLKIDESIKKKKWLKF